MQAGRFGQIGKPTAESHLLELSEFVRGVVAIIDVKGN